MNATLTDFMLQKIAVFYKRIKAVHIHAKATEAN